MSSVSDAVDQLSHCCSSIDCPLGEPVGALLSCTASPVERTRCWGLVHPPQMARRNCLSHQSRLCVSGQAACPPHASWCSWRHGCSDRQLRAARSDARQPTSAHSALQAQRVLQFPARPASRVAQEPRKTVGSACASGSAQRRDALFFLSLIWA
eukprot:scaffold19994_cov129-Isochrysis_galbana.AAC.2